MIRNIDLHHQPIDLPYLFSKLDYKTVITSILELKLSANSILTSLLLLLESVIYTVSFSQ